MEKETFEDVKFDLLDMYVEWKECPFCGNKFRILQHSHGHFLGIQYSDFLEGGLAWAIRCEGCKRYFSKKYLRPLSAHTHLYELPKDYDVQNVGAFTEWDPVAFFEGVARVGLSYPEKISYSEQKSEEKRAYISLWQAYNRQEQIVDFDRYREICEHVIGLLSDKIEVERMMKAEAFRNIGCFAECLLILDANTTSNYFVSIAQAVWNAAMAENRELLAIEHVLPKETAYAWKYHDDIYLCVRCLLCSLYRETEDPAKLLNDAFSHFRDLHPLLVIKRIRRIMSLLSEKGFPPLFDYSPLPYTEQCERAFFEVVHDYNLAAGAKALKNLI